MVTKPKPKAKDRNSSWIQSRIGWQKIRSKGTRQRRLAQEKGQRAYQ